MAMTATRVIDDHIELANIGTKTHAEIEGHIQGIGNYAFPAADGNADQLLKSNGAGVLSWIDKPAGFACGSLNACNITDIGTRAHASLTGIGTSDHHVKYTDAEVDAIVATHAGVSDAHHIPYTDAEAVAACDASNKFVESSVENIMSAETTLKKYSTGALLNLHTSVAARIVTTTAMYATVESTTHTYNAMMCNIHFPTMYAKGTDGQETLAMMQVVKIPYQNTSYWALAVHDETTINTVLRLYHNKIECKPPLQLHSIKSRATQAASGAVAKEVWKTNGHASLPDNVLLIGV